MPPVRSRNGSHIAELFGHAVQVEQRPVALLAPGHLDSADLAPALGLVATGAG